MPALIRCAAAPRHVLAATVERRLRPDVTPPAQSGASPLSRRRPPTAPPSTLVKTTLTSRRDAFGAAAAGDARAGHPSGSDPVFEASGARPATGVRP